MASNYKMLVNVSATGNNNKFYELKLDGNQVHARWGRVGADGQRKTYTGGAYEFDRLVRQKQGRGYTAIDVVTDGAPVKVVDDTRLKDAARTGLTNGNIDPVVLSLVDRLVAANAHQIGAFSGGKITVVDGKVKTPLGLLTIATIDRATVALSELQSASGSDRTRLLENYLRLIPQDVGRTRGWDEHFLTTADHFARQADFLDQLRASVQFAATQADASADDTDTASLFRYRIEKVTDPRVIKRISAKYAKTRSTQHSARVTDAKVKAVYALTDTTGADAYDKVAAALGNVQENWHGSRNANILSILSTGFIQRGTLGTVQMAGSMFGGWNCVYSSSMSTKAAQYAAGGVWSSGRDSTWFMFLVDVAMGNECLPNRSSEYVWNDVLRGSVRDRKGNTFNSIHVRAGTCGVYNQEVIAPIPQVMPRYLVEFES